jgi:hypothetical protein
LPVVLFYVESLFNPEEEAMKVGAASMLLAVMVLAACGGGDGGTNGKAERFIQTALREWAYASSSERCQAIEPWLHHYNHHRPHAGIHGATPAARLNNLLGNDN